MLRQTCGCSSAGRARPRHGRGHEVETRHPLHDSLRVCPCTPFRACMVLAVGMCAARARSTCSETPHPTGCSRLGTAEVNSRSMSRSSSRQGRRTFNPATRVRLPHAIPVQTEAIVELTLRWRKSAATIGRHRNPSPEHPCFVNSVVRVPACLAGSRGFEPRTGRQSVAAVAQVVERLVEAQGVGGSNPSRGTSILSR